MCNPPDGVPTETVERCKPNASSTGKYWQPDQPMTYKRWLHNSALLPDGRVLVVGGDQTWGGYEGCVLNPVFVAEVYDGSQPMGSRWRTLASHAPIIRDYHSTLVTLPDGRVLAGGGDNRHNQATGGCPLGSSGIGVNAVADYQIYDPDYLTSGYPRPVITIPDNAQPEPTWPYGSMQTVGYAPLPDGVSIQKVMLLRPGSVTHHADVNLRAVQLDFITSGPGRLSVFVPTKLSGKLPRGFYMLFLVSSQIAVTQGIPSLAAWVKISG